LVEAENGDLLAKRWKNYFCQLMNIHGVNNVRQTETHADKPLVPEPSSFEAEIAIEKLKKK
jgi:hypothetical protein